MTSRASIVIHGRPAERLTPTCRTAPDAKGERPKLISDARSVSGATLAGALREAMTVRIRARNADGRIVIRCRFNSPVASTAANPVRTLLNFCR